MHEPQRGERWILIDPRHASELNLYQVVWVRSPTVTGREHLIEIAGPFLDSNCRGMFYPLELFHIYYTYCPSLVGVEVKDTSDRYPFYRVVNTDEGTSVECIMKGCPCLGKTQFHVSEFLEKFAVTPPPFDERLQAKDIWDRLMEDGDAYV